METNLPLFHHDGRGNKKEEKGVVDGPISLQQ
jgi:hypothetical protein